MTDVFSKKKRSEIMSRIRAKNTSIEKKVFAHLGKNKIYFRKHYGKVAGNPDIAIPSKKIAIFIDGDFWHGYRFSSWEDRIPQKYWRKKIAMNIARDKKRRAFLRRKGWKVMRIWEHDLAERPKATLQKIVDFLLF